MKHWIQAARLRTLPLSVSGILVGCFYAMSQSLFNWDIVIFSLTTTLGLQVLSNFANDYGDGVKGTDNEDRIGPKRAIQSGVISVSSMKKAIVITSILTLLSSILLIYTAFKDHSNSFCYTLHRWEKPLRLPRIWRSVCVFVFWLGEYARRLFYVCQNLCRGLLVVFACYSDRFFECGGIKSQQHARCVVGYSIGKKHLGGANGITKSQTVSLFFGDFIHDFSLHFCRLKRYFD